MSPRITDNSVVSLAYQVTDPAGAVVDAGSNQLVYLHGGDGDVFPLIEAALDGKQVGDSVVVKLQPEDAFGLYDAELVLVEPREDFPAELQVGMQLEGGPEGAVEDSGEFELYTVTEIRADTVVLDGNHPLAGKPLIFTCTVTAIRPASRQEIADGHASPAS